jgi:Protein of unknown function (DUF1203)
MGAMSFRISGLDPAPFRPLFALDATALARAGAQRVRVRERPSAPCRITLDDAEVGEEVLLLGYEHQSAATPYRQQGPIFVRNTAERFDALGVIAPALAIRPLSLRGYDRDGIMVEADLVEGAEAPALIARFFGNEQVAYIHAHYARRGCFAARIDRV